MKIVQIIISFVCVTFIVLHILLPDIKIDIITISLLVLAVLPWIFQFIKSIEFPGGVKVTLNKLIKTENKAREIGLIETIKHSEKNNLPFQFFSQSDPNLALAGLRIEIEKRLKAIAENNNINTTNQGLSSVLNNLTNNNLIATQERSIIMDMIGLLNSAVHGAIVDQNTANWAVNVGPELLASLDKRIKKRKK
jgi:hypothetical protein